MMMNGQREVDQALLEVFERPKETLANTQTYLFHTTGSYIRSSQERTRNLGPHLVIIYDPSSMSKCGDKLHASEAFDTDYFSIWESKPPIDDLASC
jgi:hypothetical protein